jgi:hypothetical protein
MAIQQTQTSTNFVVQYDDSNTEAKGMAAAIAAVCENEFTVLTGWFNITTGFGPSDRITVTVQSISKGGANNFGYQSGGNSTINVNFLPAGFSQSQANQIAPMMFVNELVEVFMSFNDQKGPSTWNAGHSDGEGLSQFCGILRFPAGHYLAYPSWVNSWLSSGRADWVSSNEGTDGDAVSFGCSLLFLFYLNTQLGFTPAQIIQNGSTTLAGLYTNLTGDPSNPFGFFLQLVNTVFPGTATITTGSGQQLDDPFPIFTLQFWDNKNTFSKAEVTDAVAKGKAFTDALVLDLEGFSPTQWQALGSPVPADPAGATFPGIHINRTQVEFENAALPLAPQRIHFNYDISFDGTSAGGFTTAPQTEDITTSIAISGTTVNALTELEFFGAEDPFFSSINPKVDNVPWLSQDLRVFSSLAIGTPVPGGPGFNTDSIPGARTYLQALLKYLNANYSDPSLTDPFDAASNVIPGQTDALQGDTSVIPNLGFLGLGPTVYNFAVARVRLGGAVGTVSKPVKVFFRLWQSQSPDTNYSATTTYNSHSDSAGLPDWPLPDPDSSTFPFFATSNTPNFASASDPEFGTNGVNSQVITVNHGQGQWTYFGCLLNVYDGTYLVNGTPVTQLLPGTHHCLVAQIAYDDAPILTPNGQTVAPGNTDKLAQRNLQISPAFNPGKPPTNRVPQTFDIRPSAVQAGPGTPVFDELMIDWGETPVGAVASIYWPGVSAAQVLNLANQRYAYHSLAASDANTIQCQVVKGSTYVPIPAQAGQNFAGLLTVEMPPTVVKGQQFTVIVRRVTTYTEPVPPPPPPLQSPAAMAGPAHSASIHSPQVPGGPLPHGHKAGKRNIPATRTWRYITGAFQVNIPVQKEDEILPFDMNTLAIFKWRLEVMPKTNRWYPVLVRYIQYLSDRINGLGGDAGAIEPSPTGLPGPVDLHHKGPKGPKEERHEELTGKVCEVLYDCFGDFEGFVLEECCRRHAFPTRERGVGDLVLRACRERLLVSVFLCEERKRISRIVVRC